MRLHVGEIGEPQPVRCRCGEVPVDQIRGPLGTIIADGGPRPGSTPTHTREAHIPHEPFHGAACHPDTVDVVEVIPHLVGSVGDVVLLVDPSDHRPQFGITHRPCRRQPGLGGVIRLWGNAKSLGDRLDSPPQQSATAIFVLVDEPDHFFDWRSSSAPKKADAAFRMSLARRSSAFSRFNRFNSASSSLVGPFRRPVSRSA